MVHANGLGHVAVIADSQVSDVVRQNTAKNSPRVNQLLDAVDLRFNPLKIYIYNYYFDDTLAGSY